MKVRMAAIAAAGAILAGGIGFSTPVFSPVYAFHPITGVGQIVVPCTVESPGGASYAADGNIDGCLVDTGSEVPLVISQTLADYLGIKATGQGSSVLNPLGSFSVSLNSVPVVIRVGDGSAYNVEATVMPNWHGGTVIGSPLLRLLGDSMTVDWAQGTVTFSQADSSAAPTPTSAEPSGLQPWQQAWLRAHAQ